VYLVNKATKVVVYAGDVPEAYATITGLRDIDYTTLKDLHATFRENDSDKRYEHLGFLTEADARAAGVTDQVLAKMRAAAWEVKWTSLDQDRQDLIEAQRWRIDRYNDEIALNRTPTEDITPVLLYIQEIRDLPVNCPDPYNIVWPTIPPLPGA
jgi:hypothetical protein